MTWTPHENKPLLVRFSEWLVEPDEWPAWVQFFLLPKPLGRENFFFVRVVLLIAMAFFSLQAFFGGPVPAQPKPSRSRDRSHCF